MYCLSALFGDISIRDLFRLRAYKRDFDRKNRGYFRPDGTIVFCGPQGSGKTLSAVRYVRRLKEIYPEAIVISNIKLTGIDTIEFQGLDDMSVYPNNGIYGTIILIDEIQIEFNSLESLNVSPSEMAVISQQRKRRVHIVGTSQLFTRISKVYREQITAAIDCSCLFNSIQKNSIIDFDACAYDINGNLTKTAYTRSIYWTRSPRDFESYDTTTIVTRKGGSSRVYSRYMGTGAPRRSR